MQDAVPIFSAAAVIATEKERASRWYQTLTCFNSHHLTLARNTIYLSSAQNQDLHPLLIGSIKIQRNTWCYSSLVIERIYTVSILYGFYMFGLYIYSYIRVCSSLMGLILSIVIFLWFLLYFLLVFYNCKSLAMSSEINPRGQPYGEAFFVLWRWDPIMTMKMYVYTHITMPQVIWCNEDKS